MKSNCSEYIETQFFKIKKPYVNEELTSSISQNLFLNTTLAKVLIARGLLSFKDVQDFLYPHLTNLHDPFLLSNIGDAANMILKTIIAGDPIIVYGDNDIDGMSSVALLVEFLRNLGGKVFFAVSSFQKFRHEIIVDSIPLIKRQGCKLLITVDCGVTSGKQIRQIKSMGVEVIVTDHHEPVEDVPQGIVIVNPKNENDAYPNKDIAGVGVAFKVVQAISIIASGESALKGFIMDTVELMDLVAFGTISDMEKLLGENRIFVKYGLLQLKKMRRIGLKTLFDQYNFFNDNVDSEILLKILSILNSLGRIGDATKGVELFLSTDVQQSIQLVGYIKSNNKRRRQLEKNVFETIQRTEKLSDYSTTKKVVVYYSEDLYMGIVPIISSKITRIYNIPCAIIATNGDLAKGSLRTIPKLPLLSFLKKNAKLLKNFGGHDFAAGITLLKDNIGKFQELFTKYVEESVSIKDLKVNIDIDADIEIKNFSPELLDSLELLQPYGYHNSPPNFYISDCKLCNVKFLSLNSVKISFKQNNDFLVGYYKRKKTLSHAKIKKHKNIDIICSPHIFGKKFNTHVLIHEIIPKK